VETIDESGGLVAPTRFESAPRLALRRAIAALETGRPRDLGDLLDDAALADIVLSATRT
jgi:hypothetical protein